MSPSKGSRASKRLHGGALETLPPPPVVVDLSEPESRMMSRRKSRRLSTGGASAAANLGADFIDLDAMGEMKANSDSGRKSKRLSGGSPGTAEAADIEFRMAMGAGEDYDGKHEIQWFVYFSSTAVSYQRQLELLYSGGCTVNAQRLACPGISSIGRYSQSLIRTI